MPQALWDLREKLRETVGAKSVNAMFVGGFLYWMMHGRPHWLTNSIMDLSEDAQDEVIDGAIRKFLAGETLNGNYFEHVVEDAVAKVANGQDVERDEVISEIIKSLRAEVRNK
jgi:hypothetical protein